MRILTDFEKNNIKTLTKNQVSFTLIEPTETGLKKSIMDATGSVRSFLKENNIHDFDRQSQGPTYKITINATIYNGFSILKSKASLYRPITKNGDPRIWFSGLTKITKPNDIISIVFFDQEFHIFNITQLNIEQLLSTSIHNPFKELILEIKGVANQTAYELLTRLREIAKAGPVPSMLEADTSIGRTLETMLGISINSSKQPDYKGIELKSYRSGRSNRKNLFAQVPDWSLSKFKSSAEILAAFGYSRNSEFKLYCTVSSLKRNPNGLKIRLDSEIKQVIEDSDNPEIGDFVVWRLETLHNRLHEKHRETFWVEADSIIIDHKEHFQYKMVEHTKKPISSQFDFLLDQGIITLDHLIKRKVAGNVVEKGPIFKIKPKGLDLLFPPSEKYSLI